MKKVFLTIVILWCSNILSCGPDPIRDSATFEDMVLEGWTSYSQNEFETAIDWFKKAGKKNPSAAEPLTGLAWTFMKMDSLSKADTYFSAGASKQGVPPDHYAGWSFLKNANKEYVLSNQFADEALSMNANWSFVYAVGLNAADLQLLMAQNYFMTGDYSNSLIKVKILNPSFETDIFDSAGQALLAKEIERLRKLV